ncbi:hypothetical protein CAPTEDRAFT_162073 [Capitella teleta]|uniref:Tyrosine aminotransferase n=1 Tax=Capitella teleta TaxID=283909 RepID=R7UIX6_CAPTE|nr:hypothetical protein CAPTEDRAFT_162073 [Capitella teleta]|eukprot:ELU03237.1 hypothetical protein CAPTEDRAFT_162073 [Capitella teleta]
MAKNTSNPIRKIVDGMKLTPNPNKEMIALSIGDPTVFGNLLPAEVVNAAVVESVKDCKHNGYAPSVGYEKARQAVADHYSLPSAPLTSQDVIFASGCSSALDLAISVLANEGQNILVPRPGFSLYQTLANSLGISVRHYDLLPDHGWQIDLGHMESLLDDHTAAIVVNNPSNPCGSVFSQEHIKDILKIADKNKVPIIADEIYAHFVFPGHEYFSMASQTEDVPIISAGGLTKRYLVPGWRMGWLTIHDRHDAFKNEIRPGLLALTTRILGPNTLIQGALETILTKTPQEFFDSTIAVVKANADIAFEALSKIPGLKPVMPSGAMYMMVGIDMEKFPEFHDDKEFASAMVTEQSVFCLPAQCFKYPDYFRVVLTVPQEKLQVACERIEEFCRDHYTVTNGANGME